MQILTLTFLALGAISTAADSKQGPKVSNLTPRETLKAWQRRGDILAGGGWPLLATTCPILSAQFTDGTCCPDSLIYNPTSGAEFDVRAACCPDSLYPYSQSRFSIFQADTRWHSPRLHNSIGHHALLC